MSKLERLESTIQRTLSEIIQRDVKDSGIGFITLTEIRLTNDYSFLTVFYTILGQDPKKEAAKKALIRSTPFIKRQLAHKVKMRKTPNIIFKYDSSLEQGNRIEQGLKKVMNKE